jgi:hypothetical protein
MRSPYLLWFHIISVPLLESTAASQFRPAALQSGPDKAGGSSTISKILYNAEEHSVWVIGNSAGETFFADESAAPLLNQPSCFVAKLRLLTEGYDGMEWMFQQMLLSQDRNEGLLGMSCISGAYQYDKLILTAHDEKDGKDHTTKASLLELDWNQSKWQFEISKLHPLSGEGGSSIITKSRPVSVSWLPEDDALYTALQEESDPSSAAKSQVTVRKFNVEWMAVKDDSGGGHHLDKTLTADWTVHISVQAKRVDVAAVSAVNKDRVLLTGTESTDNNQSHRTGYVRMYGSAAANLLGQSHALTHHAIVNMCHDGPAGHIYVTGWTTGKYSELAVQTAFLAKIAVATLETQWTVQMDSTGPSSGVACAVTRDDSNQEVWWGGWVEGKILTLTGDVPPFGGRDVFVSKVRADDGAFQFVQQTGSREDDELVDVAVDAAGNCIAAGNTFGSFYRSRQSTEAAATSDVFVFTVSRTDGSIPLTEDSTGSAQQESTSEDPTEKGVQREDGRKGRAGFVFFVVLMVSLLVCCCCCLFIRYHYRNKSRRRHSSASVLLTQNALLVTDRSHLMPILDQFDARDVDLKRSATGGWHGCFSNELAQGRNNYRPEDVFGSTDSSDSDNDGLDSFLCSGSPYTDSSLFNEDILFMGDKSAGSGGLDDHGGVNDGPYISAIQRSSAYNGLVDAYETRRRSARTISDIDGLVEDCNRTWDDLVVNVAEDGEEPKQSDQEII